MDSPENDRGPRPLSPTTDLPAVDCAARAAGVRKRESPANLLLRPDQNRRWAVPCSQLSNVVHLGYGCILDSYPGFCPPAALPFGNVRNQIEIGSADNQQQHQNGLELF